MKLRHIMTRDVLTFAPGHNASDALATMRDAGVRHGVVTSLGSIVGVVSERDLGGRHGGTLRQRHTVEDLMRRAVCEGDAEMKIERAALLMQREHVGCLPIVERGRLVGIVTRGDLLVALATGRRRKHANRPRLDVKEEMTPPSRDRSPNRDKWP